MMSKRGGRGKSAPDGIAWNKNKNNKDYIILHQAFMDGEVDELTNPGELVALHPELEKYSGPSFRSAVARMRTEFGIPKAVVRKNSGKVDEDEEEPPEGLYNTSLIAGKENCKQANNKDRARDLTDLIMGVGEHASSKKAKLKQEPPAEPVARRPTVETTQVLVDEWKPIHTINKWIDPKQGKHLVIAILLPTGVAYTDTKAVTVKVESGNVLKLKINWPEIMQTENAIFEAMAQGKMYGGSMETHLRTKACLNDKRNELIDDDESVLASWGSIELPHPVMANFDISGVKEEADGTRLLVITCHAPPDETKSSKPKFCW